MQLFQDIVFNVEATFSGNPALQRGLIYFTPMKGSLVFYISNVFIGDASTLKLKEFILSMEEQ